MGHYVKNIILAFLLTITGGVTVAIAMSDVAQNKIHSWRYKMTVEVETPEGIRTGSAVREISNSPRSIRLPDAGNPAENRGEAVVVDLGKRGVLFVLISDKSDDQFYQAIPSPGYGGTTNEAIEFYGNLKSGVKGELTRMRPRMVTFKHLDDPKSVRLVYSQTHEETTDNFEEVFGKGVRLKKILIETTDEPVTSGVESLLPWLRRLQGGYLHGGKTSRGAPLGLYGGNFRRES